MLSYTRRAVIAVAMTRAAIQAGMGEYARVQQRELASRLKYVGDLQQGFQTKIAMYLQSVQSTSSATETKTRTFTNASRLLWRAEQQERAAGTAKTINIGQ